MLLFSRHLLTRNQKRVHKLRRQEVLNALSARDFEVGIFIQPAFVYDVLLFRGRALKYISYDVAK